MGKGLRKAAAVTLMATMTLGMLSGCGSKSAGSTKDGKTKLVMSLWDEEQNKTMQKMIGVYQEQNPNVTVETQLTTWNEYWTKLEASVTGGDAADIMWVNVLKAEEYVNAGILMDVSEVANTLDLKTNYPEALVNGYNYQEKQYAIPKDFDTNGLFYNKELFDKAGVSYPTDQWTMDDFTAAAEALSKKLDKGEFACAVPFNSGQTTYQASIYANGGFMLSPDKTKVGWGEEKTMEGLAVWTNLVAKGYSASQAQMADTVPDSMFEGGKLAMLLAGNYMISTFEKNEMIKGKYDVVSRPSFNGKKTDVINGLGYAVNAQTKNKEEALKFLTWLGGAEAMEIQGKDGTVISARNDAQHYFAETNEALNLKVFTANLEDTILLEPRCKKYTELMNVQKMYLPELWDNKMTVEETCKKIQEEQQIIVDKMNEK